MTAIRTFGILLASLALIGVAEAQKGGGKVKYAVSVTANGSGTVTSNTGGISCPGTCSTTVNSGTNVSLTAIPESGAAFLGWDGDCAIYASDPICTLTVSANINATANFDNGNNPPTPYSPVVIDVACDGTGTKLQDALNALNPVANVYEVRVSGVCPELLSVGRFSDILITSADSINPATIGAIKTLSNHKIVVKNISVMITLEQFPTGSPYGIYGLYDQYLGVEDVTVICAPELVCGPIVTLYSSQNARILGISAINFSLDSTRSRRFYFERGSNVFLGTSVTNAVGLECLPAGVVVLRRGSQAVVSNRTACPKISAQVTLDSSMFYIGSENLENIEVSASKVFGVTDSTVDETTPFFETLSCYGDAIVTSYFEPPTVNHCIAAP